MHTPADPAPASLPASALPTALAPAALPSSALSLTPPEPIFPVSAPQAARAVQLEPARVAHIEQQVDAFISALGSEDVRSDSFRQRLDQAFSLGRKEIADATQLSNAFTQRGFAGEENTPAYKAISEMRVLFDELNPARQGDLLSARKVLGIPLPFGKRLSSYLRRYESAGKQIVKLHQHLVQAKDEVGKSVAELAVVRQRLWDALTQLEVVEHFIGRLDTRLSEQIATLHATEPARAKAYEQEILYYVRQNVRDVLSAKALTINAYNVAGELRKAGREVMNGCDRTATLGMAALSVAVTLARATGQQVAVMKMLEGSNQSIEALITQTGTALNEHVQRTTTFSSSPLLGLQTLQAMFDQTLQAVATMDQFRTQALGTMKQNNDMLREQLNSHMVRLTEERQASAGADAINS